MRGTSDMDLDVKSWKKLFIKLRVIPMYKYVILCHKGPQNFPHLEIPFQWIGSQDNVDS